MENTSGVEMYVAFLRGINVGGRTFLKMEELKKAFEALGFRHVKTVLASGNVLFEASRGDAAALSGTIGKKLREVLGREVVVIVRPLEDLRKLQALRPFEGTTAGMRLFVTLLPEKCRDISSPSMRDGFRILSVSDGMICSVLDERPGVGAVHLMGAIEKEFGPRVTTRTWNTILRILRTGDAD
ncbi:MAG TPA: DUF1697 domain-containing protein [Methanocella sp.]|nr:DUF1697 domain-containing protein [Methanocella sp.]